MTYPYPFWVNDFDRVKDHKINYPLVSKIFEHPVAFWYGETGRRTMDNLEDRISRLLRRATPFLPVLVLYNLPGRDIGQYSKGGAGDREHYLEFVTNFSNGIGTASPMVIFEPDAIPHAMAMDRKDAVNRFGMINDAIEILSINCNAKIYVDLGHSNWLNAKQAADLYLKAVGDSKEWKSYGVYGFSVNVSNYRTTEESVEWAEDIRRYLGLKGEQLLPGYVIDTSRNGNGPYDNEWCNPPGRALGHPPTTDTGIKGCDAFVWAKIPGESDGKRNGGPRAGRFWPEYATELVENTEWMDTDQFNQLN